VSQHATAQHVNLTSIDFREHSVDQAEFARFDGDSMVAVHLDLVKARGAV
jgi:hypothetical protein